MKYRGKFDIIALIIKGAVGGSQKTRLMYLSYVSYMQLEEYLDYLMENGLLVKTREEREVAREGKATYTTTSKGLLFVAKYGELEALLTQKG